VSGSLTWLIEVAAPGAIPEGCLPWWLGSATPPALSVVIGFVVALGLGASTFAGGRAALGLIVIACSGVAIALGVAGLVLPSGRSGRPG
jgi:hypothetical protein